MILNTSPEHSKIKYRNLRNAKKAIKRNERETKKNAISKENALNYKYVDANKQIETKKCN